jgi:outer membrane translocation and assembly module TamA
VNFFNFSEGFDAGSSLLGRDFRDPYLLSFAEFQAASYWVNSITAPTDGVILEFGQGIAAEAMMSDFEYHRTTLQARGYSRLFPWLQLASRLKAGLISPFGERGSAPFDKRFSLGGANTVRGFGSRRLSPRLNECNADGVCESIPVGGYTMLQANVELRMRLIQPVWLVAFADAGDVQEKALTVDVDEWNFTAGPGVRVDTPLGLVRLDAGFRLNDPGVFPDEPSWGIYFGLGETL